MKNAEVLAILRKHVGPVRVAMVMRNDCLYVQVVKADLIELLAASGGDNEVEASLGPDGILYVDRA